MSKVVSLAEAVKSIPNGSHVALSGFAITRCTMAFGREVLRQGLRDLTISQCVGAMDADLMVGGGAVKRLIYGGGSLDRFGRLANVNRGIEDGSLIVEEYSSLSVAFRYLAGSLGLPFMPINSLKGSDLLRQISERTPSDIAFITDPFTGEEWLVLKPLQPDVAVVQVQIADAEGNAWIKGPRWDNVEQAKASKRTIVIAEKVVPADFIRQNPEQTVIPGLLVSHVVEQPFASHPTSVYGEYDYDAGMIERYVKAYASADSFKAYLDEFVYDTQDEWEYLQKAGGLQHLNALRADPILGY
jgi:glutaconate CoA-transferase, subunit A